jgi:MbtH protein
MQQVSGEKFMVVANSEEQRSIIPASWVVPAGWSAEGFTGSMLECMAHVDSTWLDLRPKSLRDGLRAAESRPAGREVRRR